MTPLFPEQASTFAGSVDALYLFLIAVTAFFSLLIGTLVVVFALKFRRKSADEVATDVHESGLLEIVWTVIPFCLTLVMFFWGAKVFFQITRPPANAIEIYVTAKQWMWKLQHEDGHREMNELHVPIGQPVRLTMASEDVIHSFFVPAFRFKRDVVPGRFSTAWFEATKPGKYHLFCAEFCGTRHSGMIGWVYAMSPADYQAWLAGGTPGETLASAGAKRFVEQACNTCHGEQKGARGPSLTGLYGSTVHMQGGQTLVADETYIRDSIVNPQARLLEGYPPIMPTYQGLISEEGLLQLTAYIKSLSLAPAAGASRGAPPRSARPGKEVQKAMSTATGSGKERVNYLNAGYGVKSWLLTTDHKRIAILYLIGVTIFFALGGLAAALVRLELLTPAGDVFQAETYNKIFTTHGVMMVFFFMIPAIPAVLGNFLVPLMIGAKDLAFPRINLLSWYLYIIGGLLALWAVVHGGVDTGWTFYTPYSTVYSNGWVVVTAVGIFIAGFSSILTGLNFLVTIHTMRAPGMGWMRMPLFCWGMYATSIIQILGTPVIAITVLLVGAERLFHLGIFDPAQGGDPVLFQHLFWFYSHPAVYIMILPAMAVISELVTAFARKPIFGYKFIAGSSVAIAVLSFLVWGHHMFVSGQSVYAGLIFSVLSFMVAIPSAIKVFNWTATLYKGSVSYQTPMLYAIGFIGLFTFGGLTGLMLATLGLDIHVHDTYFIVAHFHYIMVGGTIMGYLGGLHYWWPKISGKMYPEYWSRVSAWIIFIGFNLTFFPQFIAGYLGMPRRYHAYPEEFQVLNVMSTAGASILGIGYLIPLIYFAWSMRYGKDAADNPWGATGLEWETPSPPPTENFPETPVVTGKPYDYLTAHEEVAVG